MSTGETDQRPWGTYTVLDEAVGHKVKRISVSPGQRLSYQSHDRRSEHWFVVAGEGVVTLDGVAIQVAAGHAIGVAARAAHRIHNTGWCELTFIEVQHGDYFGEDDITCFDDDYGREGK